jgi:DeoR family transcriptional regulator, fructose operon transcriptional repressor
LTTVVFYGIKWYKDFISYQKMSFGVEMLVDERRDLIADYIKSNEYASIEELAQKLDISESTIRRDLELLEKSGVLERVHGGAKKAVGLEKAMSFTFFKDQININKEEKKRIAQFAAGLVNSGDIVIIDSGSTAYYVAEQLKNKDIQVVTNSLPAINSLAESRVDLVVVGGNMFAKAGVLLSSLTEELLNKINADKLFLGVGGIFQTQITNNNMLLVGVQKAMMEISREIIVVADHTKFNKKALNYLADISSVQHIITDTQAPEEYRDICRERNVLFTAV